MHTLAYLSTLYLSKMSVELWQRGGRLAGGQAECTQGKSSNGKLVFVWQASGSAWCAKILLRSTFLELCVVHKCKWRGLP